MRTRRIAFVGFVVLLWALMASPALALKPTWSVSQMTSGTDSVIDLHVSGSRMVWALNDGEPMSLFTWKRGDTTATALGKGIMLRNSGDRLAYHAYDKDGYHTITRMAGDETPTVLVDEVNGHGRIVVAGDRVAYLNNVPEGSPNTRVFTWKAGEDPVQLSSDYLSSTDYIQASPDRVAWMGTDGHQEILFTWAPGDTQQHQIATSEYVLDQQVSGDRVVWTAKDSSWQMAVFTWKGGDATPTQFTTNGQYHKNPVISGDRIAWIQFTQGVMQVWTQVIGESEPTQVTFGDDDCADLHIVGNRLAWAVDTNGDGSDYCVWTWKLGDLAPTKLSDHAVDDSTNISGSQIVSLGDDAITWVAPVDGIDQAFLALAGPLGDETPPTTTSDAREYYSLAATITLSAVDDPDGLGMGHTYAALDDGKAAETTQVTCSAMGEHTLAFWSVDSAGNVEATQTATFTIIDDVTPPTTTSDALPSYDDAALIHLTAEDNAGGIGVGETYFQVVGDSRPGDLFAMFRDDPIYTGSDVQVWGQGNYTLNFWSVDKAGNREATNTVTFTVVGDIIPPTTTSDVKPLYVNSATIHLTATDNEGGTGVLGTFFKVDGKTPEFGDVATVTGLGTHTIRYWSIDSMENSEATHTATFEIVATPASNGTPSKPVMPATVKHGKNFSAYGYVIRHSSGTYPVTLQFYRLQKGKWVLRKSITAKASNALTFSKYSRTTSVAYAGKWRVRAVHKVGTKSRTSGWTNFTSN